MNGVNQGFVKRKNGGGVIFGFFLSETGT